MLRDQKLNATVLENLEASRRVAESFARKQNEPAKPRGLCGRCDLRESCLYRSDGVTVWHCEEYQ